MSDEEVKKEPELEVQPEEETDDIVEFVFNADGEEDLKATLKKLRKDLKEEKAKSMEYLTSWQRERADFQNYKKEDLARRGTFVASVKESFVEDLLPALDAYDMAFANKEAWEKVDKNWRIGVEYIHTQLINVLQNHGVTVVNPQGEMFDPQRDEAVGTIETANESEDHKILEVLSVGYKLQDKLIRAPKVKIGEYKA